MFTESELFSLLKEAAKNAWERSGEGHNHEHMPGSQEEIEEIVSGIIAGAAYKVLDRLNSLQGE